MTTFETISIILSAVSLIVAAYSVMSAFAARRQAIAAEDQVKVAREQLRLQQEQLASQRAALRLASKANRLIASVSDVRIVPQKARDIRRLMKHSNPYMMPAPEPSIAENIALAEQVERKVAQLDWLIEHSDDHQIARAARDLDQSISQLVAQAGG